MNYQTLKQKRDDLVAEVHDSNLQNIEILYIEDYDKLLSFIDKYEELTRKMLQHIKQMEIGNKEPETNNQEDRKWLEHYLSLGE